MAFRCDGLVCLVTGATSGIGSACCRVLAEAGANIFAVGRNSAAGDAMIKELDPASTGQAKFYAADLRIKDSCISVADAAWQWQGRVDALVHSAGIFPSGPLLETTDEMWSDCMRLHADAFFYLSRHLAPKMVERRSGSLLAIASNYGVVGASHATAYAASKAACIALCKSMSLELASHNVRVNCVCPGATHTPMVAGSAEEYAQCSPSRELVQPVDVANAVLYLTSPAGRMVRGIELLVDGGECAGFQQGQRTQAP